MGKLFQAANSHYEWGIDRGEVFTFAKWSTGLLSMRYVYIPAWYGWQASLAESGRICRSCK